MSHCVDQSGPIRLTTYLLMKSLLRMILLNLASVLLAKNLKDMDDPSKQKTLREKSAKPLLLPVELDEKPQVDILGLGLSPPHLTILVVPYVNRHDF